MTSSKPKEYLDENGKDRGFGGGVQDSTSSGAQNDASERLNHLSGRGKPRAWEWDSRPLLARLATSQGDDYKSPPSRSPCLI